MGPEIPAVGSTISAPGGKGKLMKKTGLCFVLLLTIILTGCGVHVSSLKKSELPEGMKLEGTYADAIKATMLVFQDYGFLVKNTDYKAGLVRGESDAMPVLFFGTVAFEITATLEQIDENTVRERITIVKKLVKEWTYGNTRSSKIVRNPRYLEKIYDDIQTQIFLMENLEN